MSPYQAYAERGAGAGARPAEPGGRPGPSVTGKPVVALESTIIAHGLPRPRNLEVARELEAIVREQGACPATIAVLDGVARIGLEPGRARPGGRETRTLRKLGRRDLPVAMALGASGATTVSATAWLAPPPASGSSPPAGWAGCTGASPRPSTSRPTSTC